MIGTLRPEQTQAPHLVERMSARNAGALSTDLVRSSLTTHCRWPTMHCTQFEPRVPCGYCFSRWATERDHLRPRSAGGSDRVANLYPTCRRCNMLVLDRIFQTIEEKREYVRNVLTERGEWDYVPRMREEIGQSPSVAEILFPKMSMGKLENKQNTQHEKPAARIYTAELTKYRYGYAGYTAFNLNVPEVGERHFEQAKTARAWLKSLNIDASQFNWSLLPGTRFSTPRRKRRKPLSRFLHLLGPKKLIRFKDGLFCAFVGEMILRRCQPSECLEAIEWLRGRHYSESAPPGFIAVLEFLEGRERVGVMQLGRPASRRLNADRIMELTRMFFVDEAPKNTESHALAMMRSFVRKWYPSIRLLLAYADPDENHRGTVYEADGWAPFGKTELTGSGWVTRPGRRSAQLTPKLRWVRTP